MEGMGNDRGCASSSSRRGRSDQRCVRASVQDLAKVGLKRAQQNDNDEKKLYWRQRPHLGRPKMSLTLNTVSRSPVFWQRVKSSSRDHKGREITLVRSSLILTQGRPLIDASLITMLSALLFSFPSLDNDLKSFVKKVPIPKAATRAHGVGPRGENDEKNTNE